MSLVKLTVKQVATFVNGATQESLGETALLAEDLSNVVDIGTAVQNADLYENFTMGLLLRIGEDIYVNRPYKPSYPDIFRTNVEYGQLIAKTRGVLDTAVDNQSWKLTNNTSYDDNVYVESTYSTKVFKERDAWEIRKSIPDEQIKGAFTSAEKLTEFVSMIFTLVYNSIEVKREQLVMAVIRNMIAETIADNNAVRVVKLVSAYNTMYGASLTDANALYTKEFLQFAVGIIKKYQTLLTRYSSLYNINGAQNHTPKDLQHLVLLGEFSDNCDTYLNANTWHDYFVQLPYHDVVPYWQGTGTALGECRKVKCTTASGASVENGKVIGVLFDHDACAIFADNPTVRTKYVNSAEFTNYWFKQFANYSCDLDENCIVFTLD